MPNLGFDGSATGNDEGYGQTFAVGDTSDASGGTTATMFAYLRNGNASEQSIPVALYSDDAANGCPGSRLAQATLVLAANAAAGWYSVAFSGVTISPSTKYWVARYLPAGVYSYYASGGAEGAGAFYNAGGICPATWDDLSSNPTTVRILQYVTYEAGAAAGQPLAKRLGAIPFVAGVGLQNVW